MASIWKQPISIATLTEIHHHTTVAHLGIEFVEVADDYLRARVPVDLRTRQPYGILHGGVSVVLAETLGSCGAAYACLPAILRPATNVERQGTPNQAREHE